MARQNLCPSFLRSVLLALDGAFLLSFAESCVMLKMALPATVGGWTLHPGGDFLPLPQRRGGEAMVTYGELFAYSLVIIGIISLVFQIKKK